VTSGSRRPLRTLTDLAAAGLPVDAASPELQAVAARYAVALTPAVAELIDPTDPADPIARQFLPDPRELEQRPEERPDPIGDAAHSPVRGIVHRYPDRVLLKPLHACPVYCRFCFRREMVGPDGLGSLTGEEMAAALAYIAGRPEIWEVIVTGGDPLMLAPRRIAGIAAGVAAIPHVRVLRWHSRVPVVDPERVTPALAAALRGPGAAGGGPAAWLAVHANHPREFSPAARLAVARLADAGIALVGQTVLLKGVNDDAATLDALFRAMVECRIKPYYLHHADLAPGTGHLRTTIAEGQALLRRLRGGLSGLAQPTYVLDIPGGWGKVPVGPSYLCDGPEGLPERLEVTDPADRRHAYPAPPEEE
jgi:lysine 2,3-aminomutase